MFAKKLFYSRGLIKEVYFPQRRRGDVKFSSEKIFF